MSNFSEKVHAPQLQAVWRRERVRRSAQRGHRAQDDENPIATRPALPCAALDEPRSTDTKRAMLKTCGSDSGGVPRGKGGPTFPSDRLLVIEQARVAARVREGTTLLSVVNEDGTTQNGFLLDDIVRKGVARRRRPGREREQEAAA